MHGWHGHLIVNRKQEQDVGEYVYVWTSVCLHTIVVIGGCVGWTCDKVESVSVLESCSSFIKQSVKGHERDEDWKK